MRMLNHINKLNVHHSPPTFFTLCPGLFYINTSAVRLPVRFRDMAPKQQPRRGGFFRETSREANQQAQRCKYSPGRLF